MQLSYFKLLPKYLVYIFLLTVKFRKYPKKTKNAVSLTISWSETGPKLVTKMSVFTSVTRSDEAGNWDSEYLSTALIRSHHHILTPKWEIHWLWLAIYKIGPLCSTDNLLLTHEISQLIFFNGEWGLNMPLWETETLWRSQLLLNEFSKNGQTFLNDSNLSHCNKNVAACLTLNILTHLARFSRYLGYSWEVHSILQQALLTLEGLKGLFYKWLLSGPK